MTEASRVGTWGVLRICSVCSDTGRVTVGISSASDSGDPLPPGPPLIMGQEEDLADALRRMALEQVRVIEQGFAHEADDAILNHKVHLARKAGKRVRGLFRLSRNQLGPGRYSRVNALVRDQARRLSDVRSAAVLQGTLDELVASTSLTADSVSDLRRLLSERHAQGLLRLRTDSDGRASSREVLGRLADRIARHPAPLEYAEADFTALQPAIRRIYRRGRRAKRRAERLDTAHGFHEWRKRVNYLRFQMEALRGACAPPIDGLAEALGELSELLGEDHDLADLLDVIDTTTVAVPSELRDVIDTRSKALREEALRRGSELFSSKPKGFVRFFAEHSRRMS